MEDSVAGLRRVGKEIRPLAEEVAFVGVDVHKRTYTVSVWTERRGRVARWTQPADLEHWSTAAVEELRRLALAPELRFCLDSLLRDHDRAREEFHACEKAMAELARSERHRREVAAMRQVPGVGVATALTHALELPRPERFTRGEEVASSLGLAPRTSRSGSTSKGGPIRKAGNRRLRRVLVEAAPLEGKQEAPAC